MERNLYWVTDGICQSAFLTTDDGVVLLDAPPTIGGNLRRALDEIAAANGARRQHHTRGFREHAEQVLKLTAPPEPDRIAMPLSGASQIMRSLRPDRSRRAVSPATVPSSRLRRR